MMTGKSTSAFLAVLTVLALFFSYLLIAPFLKPIVFAAILAIILYPLHAWVRRRIRHSNAAAAVSTTVAILFVATASFFLGRALLSGLGDIYESLGRPGDNKERLSFYIVHLLERIVAFVGHYISISVPDLQAAIVRQAEQMVSSLLTMSAGALTRMTALFGDALVAFFVLFFLFRDGRSMLRRAAVFLPLRRGQVRHLYAGVRETLNAIFYGTLAMAAIQGALTGLGFLLFGLASPFLWGIVASFCALLPVLGTAIVFIPAISMVAFNGYWIKALILSVWAIAVVNPADNILRPYFIGERANLPTLYVFVALLGGLEAFGPLGLFLGPVILSVTLALFKFLREQKKRERGGYAAQLPAHPQRNTAVVRLD